MKDLKEPLFKYETVLVLLDGSELAEQALIPALIIAESMTAKVQLLQVVTGLTLNLDPTLNQRLVNKRERIANQYLESLQLRYSKAGAIIDTKTAVGPAAKTIIDFAKDYDVDLIVMSSHGHTVLNGGYMAM